MPSHTPYVGAEDVPQLIDFLHLSGQEPGTSGVKTPAEQIIQRLQGMAVAQIQLKSCSEPIGQSHMANQLRTEALCLLAELEELDKCDYHPVALVVLAVEVAQAFVGLTDQLALLGLIIDDGFQLKLQLLVDRMRSAGFELPEVNSRDVFADTWKRWRRYVLVPGQ